MNASAVGRFDHPENAGLSSQTASVRLPAGGCGQAAGLAALMEATAGRAEIIIAMIDGPVAVGHPDFHKENMRYLDDNADVWCRQISACVHGTFVAGLLHARRDAPAPGLCPGCTLLIRPIFHKQASTSASPDVLACAIITCVEAGARAINLSADMPGSQMFTHRGLEEALDAAGARGVIVIAAAGNQPILGSSLITRHRSVVPVVACDAKGVVLPSSTLGASIGRQGLAAPGHDIISLAPSGGLAKLSGSSAAAAFVTGTVALLWSAFPRADTASIRRAVLGGQRTRRAITPPLLDARVAYASLRATQQGA